MLITQPFYIGGIKDVAKAKGSAFGAATAFFFTFVASILYVIRDARRYTQSEIRRSGSGGGGNGNGNGGLDPAAGVGMQIPRQLQNPFSNRAGSTSLFHDYDPVDTDAPEGILS